MRFIRQGVVGASMIVVAGSAFAQSSVTLYGTVDAFVQFLGNGSAHSWSERSGGSSASDFGLKGSEDLGGGTHAIFQLENGFTVNNGAFFVDSNAMFYRQAWVGLRNEAYGSLTFGRQYQPSFYAIYPTEPFFANELLSPLAAVLLASDPHTLATQLAVGRTSNSVMYQTPKWAGLKGYAMYGWSSTQTAPIPETLGNMLDLALTWTWGGLYAGIAYQSQHAASATLPLARPTAIEMPRTEHFAAALAYRIGIVNLQANYSYIRPQDPAPGSLVALAGMAHAFNTLEVGADIQASAADVIEIAGIERSVRGVHDNSLGFQIGIDHSLSKRTAVYARAGYIKNNGSAVTSWPGIVAQEPGSSQTLAVIGMTHRF